MKQSHGLGHDTSTEAAVQAKGAPSGYIPPSSSFATPPNPQQLAQYDSYFKSVSVNEAAHPTSGENSHMQKEIVIPPRPNYMLPVHPSRIGYSRPRVSDSPAIRMSRRVSELSFADAALAQAQVQAQGLGNLRPQSLSISRSATHTEVGPSFDPERSVTQTPSTSNQDDHRLRFNRLAWESDAEGGRRERPTRRRQTEPFMSYPLPASRYSEALTSQESISSSHYIPHGGDNNASVNLHRNADVLSQLSGFAPLQAYTENRESQIGESSRLNRHLDRRESTRRGHNLYRRSGVGTEFNTAGQANDNPEALRGAIGFAPELRHAISMISGSNETLAATYGSLTDIPVHSRPHTPHTPVVVGDRRSLYNSVEAPTQDFTPERRNTLNENPPRTPLTPSRTNSLGWPMAAAYENVSSFEGIRYPSGYASEEALTEWMANTSH